MSTTLAASSATTARTPKLLRLSWSRGVIELKQFFRQPDAVFFSFLLPVLFVVIFSTVFDEDIEGPPGVEPVPFPQYFVAGIIAAGIMATSFTTLATSIANEQHNGTLKRLGGTPLPKTAYFAGKIVLAVVTSVVQAAIILSIGVTFYDMSLPASFDLWVLFAGVFVLGVASCSMLGIAYTRLIVNANAAATVVQPPYLVLQFISGVFFPYNQVPGFLQAIASVFPLKWMVQGFRQVFLPDWVAIDDYGGSWQTEWVFVMLVVWVVGPLLVARRTFRWDRTR